jgi:hypothetical protein
MTILQTLGQVPPMLYASMLLLPIALYGFMAASAPKKTISARAADPADQLKEKKIDAGREIVSSVFLGATIAFGAAAMIIIGGVIMDYKNSRGLFAVTLPAATLPPASAYILPLAPEVDGQGSIVGNNKVIDPSKTKGGILD